MSSNPLGNPNARTPKRTRPHNMVIRYSDEERAAWDADALFLGFRGFGSQYYRFILNARAGGRMLLLDPSTEHFFEVIGRTFGEAAGEVVAKMQRAFLEGR
jgi:hypothetical protein